MSIIDARLKQLAGINMVAITEQAVEEQKQHTFAKNTFYFDHEREARTHDVTLVRSLEIDPATMVPKKGNPEPFPGVIRLHFMPQTTDLARKQIRAALVQAVPGELGGRDSDPWFTLTPETGIVTPEAVQATLRVLYENNAIVLPDVVDASKAIGLKPSAYWKDGDRPRDLKGLHDPKKPEDDRKVAELVAELHQRPGGRY